MISDERLFVPFESLWKMPIDVPYSLLVRDGDHAWSCGQLALDADSNVLAADDLVAQSTIVADYIAEVLDRGGLAPEHLKRLVLYYTAHADHAGRVAAMRSVFSSVLGSTVLLDVVAVPHFYYDGIELEVDAFAGPTADDRFDWVSIEVPASEYPDALAKVDPSTLLSAHWFAPAAEISTVAAHIEDGGLVHDAGAVVSTGPGDNLIRGSLLRLAHGQVDERSSTNGDVRITTKQAEGVGWIAARCTNSALGLPQQTELIMDAIAGALADEGADFDAVVKSTTLYVGDSSSEDLHTNMAVRNRRYQKPGPASTGLPIFGLADRASRLTVDVMYLA